MIHVATATEQDELTAGKDRHFIGRNRNMTVMEFWEKANRILKSYSQDDDPDGCDFFVGEMDELFEDWQNAK